MKTEILAKGAEKQDIRWLCRGQRPLIFTRLELLAPRNGAASGFSKSRLLACFVICTLSREGPELSERKKNRKQVKAYSYVQSITRLGADKAPFVLLLSFALVGPLPSLPDGSAVIKRPRMLLKALDSSFKPSDVYLEDYAGMGYRVAHTKEISSLFCMKESMLIARTKKT